MCDLWGRIRSCWSPHLDFGQRILILRMMMMTIMMEKLTMAMDEDDDKDDGPITFPHLDFWVMI